MEQKGEKSVRAQKEEDILQFWKEHDIFKKSLTKKAPKGDCVFYDGPPFATGLPHYGHILGGTGKDVIARYKTMQGFRVPRKWGWDTHGLPIETIVEKSLGVKSKKDIEAMGLDTFSREARSKVLGFVAEWKSTVERTGRWVDFDGSYKTMDATYIESVWWALGELWKKKLVYEADRVLPYCPRCQTPLANAEIAMDNSYVDITDISLYVKFKIAGKANEYFLAWTTTPWTLPGNTALAVHPDFTYASVLFEGNTFVLLKEKVEHVFKDKNYTIVNARKGSTLVGISYEPLFPQGETFSGKAFQVYPGTFVTADTGTGIVHIAPAFGEDDMQLARNNAIPARKHVTLDGKFQAGIPELDGHAVKPKDDHQSGDVLIIKYLAPQGVIFAKEKIVHSYPHCYRCGTPILYYGLPSWFIKVQHEKKKLLALNKNISWIPEHLRDGRFKYVLENAPDWNISRNRFWASPIPVWKSPDGTVKFIDSFATLKKFTKKSGNTYFGMRHGYGQHMTAGVVASLDTDAYHLTPEGHDGVIRQARKLRSKKITKIFCSPLIRTKETAYRVADVLGIPREDITVDDRIREYDFGEWDGKPFNEYVAYRAEHLRAYDQTLGGTSMLEVKKRIGEFMYELESTYANENILIVTHGIFFEVLPAILEGADNTRSLELLFQFFKKHRMQPAEVRTIDFVPLPHNEQYELDPHRPYIDAIKLKDSKGREYTRIPEVIDCWFESGSMPFAQDHVPFERKNWKKENFPADFVVEYIAQTRTWFYYTLLVSSLLFGKAPFRHVVTTGNLNAEDGKKMSKSLNNYPDPQIILDTYGADALRLYLMSSVLMQGEDSNFIESSVDEVYKKIITRLDNCLSFLLLYPGNKSVWGSTARLKNVLDQWIMSRLGEVVHEITLGMEKYHIVEATRPIADFVDDLSTWYVRRSRERFKSGTSKDKEEAQKTLTTVLKLFAQAVAPFIPFLAETLYQAVRKNTDPISVHLEKWPKVGKVRAKIVEDMKTARDIVSQGLEARAKAGIKVRQPLQTLEVSDLTLASEYLELICDEVNVKRVIKGSAFRLDTTITQELKQEGHMRELLRVIQDLRKKTGLQPDQKVVLSVSTNDEGKQLIAQFQSDIQKTANISKILFKEVSAEEVSIGTMPFKLSL